jgi:glycine/D-amino acid oxidase-like deaminating enzyme
MSLPASLWAATAAAAPQAEPIRNNTRTDVLVVGAGYTGLSTALHLAEKGVDVTVLEAHELGFGGSGRNMGQINTGFLVLPDDVEKSVGSDLGQRMNQTFAQAADLVFELIERHNIDCDAVRAGNFFLAHDPRSHSLIEKYRDQHERWGAPLQWLEGPQLQSALGSARYSAGVLDERSGTLQPLSYVHGLARAAIAAGAKIHCFSRVSGLTQTDTSWHALTQGGLTVDAEQVVLATDSYSDALYGSLDKCLLPITAQQVATEPLGENVGRSILDGGQATADRMRFTHYFRKDRDGRLLMVVGGATLPAPELLKRFFPQLADVRFDYQWSGVVGVSPTHLPRVHKPAAGLTALTGYSGRGLTTATMAGKLLAEHLTGELGERDLPMPIERLSSIPFRGLKSAAISGALAAARWVDSIS